METINPLNIPDNTIFFCGGLSYKKIKTIGTGKNARALLFCIEKKTTAGMTKCKINIIWEKKIG